MKDEDKTEKQLKYELVELRQKTAELNASEIETKQAEERTDQLKAANEQLLQEVIEHRQKEKVQASMYKISEAAHATENLEELHRSIHNIITELMPAKNNFYIALYDEDTEMFKFPYFVDEYEENPGPQKLEKGLTEYVFRTGKPLLASPEVFDKLEKKGEVKSVGPPSIDWLGVPLKTKDRTIGVLTVQSYTEGVRYSEEDKKILTFISEQVAMVIEHKRAEEALQTEKAYLDQLFDNAQEAIVMTDNDGRVLRVNSEFIRLFGYTSDESVGRLIDDLISTKALRKEAESYTKQLAEGKKFAFESLRQHKDGKLFNVSSIGAPIIVGDKQVAVYAIYRDITDRKNAEEKLKQTLAELERSNKELEQFAYMASHDLQEPLRMVSSYTQLLARRYKDKLDSDANEFIEYAVDGATRMQTLINDLLAYSRVSTRGEPFELTDCETILKKVIANLQVAIEESGAVITHDPLPTVMVDASQLIHLFQNLIDNAVKFRSEVLPRVHISAKQNGNELIFSFRDNGIGINPQYRERIFVLCQRLHGKGEYPGTGIGLAICKKIVERHNGRIWVESNSKKGSAFYFTIPIKGDK